MLDAQMRKARHSPAPLVILLAGGLLAGVLLGMVLSHGTSKQGSAGASGTVAAARSPLASASARSSAVAGSPGRSQPPSSGMPPASAGTNGSEAAQIARRAVLASALGGGIRQADELGGEAAAAVWVAGDRQPVLSGPTSLPHRMWSISKAVVTIAALRATHDRPDPMMSSAILDAIRRSDNCAIRRVIVGLQYVLNEGVAGTIAAFESAMSTAGAGIDRPPQAAPAEQACVHYLDSHKGSLPGSDLITVPQFGTAEWSEYDAIAFAHSLSLGAYGRPGAYLLKLMGLPKEGPAEEAPPPSAPPLDWGAGAAFPAEWKPAWKAGWGGSQNDPPHFIAGQIVVLHIAALPVAVAAVFAPMTEPSTDNPGATVAPRALEEIFTAVKTGLEQEQVGQGR
jgi:hypothetical protein